VKLYRTRRGIVVERDAGEEGPGLFLLPETDWDVLVNRDDLAVHLAALVQGRAPLPPGRDPLAPAQLLPPIGSQEVWAAGVTYFRSRTARMEESKGAGGGDFYDRVYGAERPELFYKASARRVAGHGQGVRIRGDSRWNVPEPELTVLVSSNATILGYTVGNDMSSRDIEGENPLYLPQAKVYDRSCALGPGVLVTAAPLPPAAEVGLEISRQGAVVFSGSTPLSNLKRQPSELIEFLYRDCSFPNGCFLLTGTGVVPPDEFTLAHGDRIRITIDGIGTLENHVE
jgi:2-dehydro-3-deoxy-D-arabinonate dehydratase